MRVLILSFYYPPDIGPGALRAKSLVDALMETGDKGLEIDVITAIFNVSLSSVCLSTLGLSL